MSTQKVYWRLKRPYSQTFFSGYVAGHKWAKLSAHDSELMRIAEALLNPCDVTSEAQWPFTHTFLDQLETEELASLNTAERFYRIIRPHEMARGHAARFFSQVDGAPSDLWPQSAQLGNRFRDEQMKCSVATNEAHFFNGFLFGAFHYWLDL